MKILFFTISVIVIRWCSSMDEPCDTTNQINEWKRSVAYSPQINDQEICDFSLKEGWYRITSKAGEKMPTKCPKLGYRCCTTNSVWLSAENVANGEDLFPKDNDVVDRVACSSGFDGDCCKEKYQIKIKNCGTHFVYNLPPTKTCNTAYCFGDKLPCPQGESSETGFQPGCGSYPQVTVKPSVKTDLNIRLGPGLKDPTIDFTYETVKFECVANVLPKYRCNVRWYINDFPISAATQIDVPANKLDTAILFQYHWEKTFQPNMKVKCSIQIKEVGFPAPGPEQFSEDFMAGLIVNQREFSVVEGESVSVPVKLTIPIGCSYPTTILPKDRIDQIRGHSCALNLLAAVPKIQQTPDNCKDQLTTDSLSFQSESCGIFFTNLDWQTQQLMVVNGASDNVVNLADRIAVLRLYSDVKTNINELDFWHGMILPDLRFRVIDKDNKLLGKTCSSNNDPHMSTFDGQYYSFHEQVGEYVLYRHTSLPVEIHAYYRKCNFGALCNCGAAIRSGDSAFVANFCPVNNHPNHYVTQKVCADSEMQVHEMGNTYQITTMSGTEVTIILGEVYDFFGLNSFVIKASALDMYSTEGLCGTLNNDKLDDLIPRGGKTPVVLNYPGDNIDDLGKSWMVTEQKESLFNIYDIKPTVYHLTPFCTCAKLATSFPFGEPEFNCKINSQLTACMNKQKVTSIYHTPCKHSNYKTKRKRSVHTGEEVTTIKLYDDNAPEMFIMIVNDGEKSTVDTNWKNGWNAPKARDFCMKHFQSSNAFTVCSDHVPSVPSEKFINECVEDIKIAGDSSWLDVSLNNFGSACFHEASKIENLTRSNTTEPGNVQFNIFTIIAEATCPKNCSNRGQCENGFCNCTGEYFGAACERRKNEAPKILTDGFDGLCDISIKPCKKYVIPGLHFKDGALTCKYRHFRIELNETIETGTVEYVDGEYSSMFSMRCPSPSSRHKRAVNTKQSALGYFISVSNDGKNFTEELAVIIYDSMCFECNTSSLTCEEVPSCPKKNLEVETSNTGSYVGAGIGGAAAVIVIAIVFLLVKKKIKKRMSNVKDSTGNLPNDFPKTRKSLKYDAFDEK